MKAPSCLRLVRNLAAETTHGTIEESGKFVVTLCGIKIPSNMAKINDGHILNCKKCIASFEEGP